MKRIDGCNLAPKQTIGLLANTLELYKKRYGTNVSLKLDGCGVDAAFDEIAVLKDGNEVTVYLVINPE